jgi:hypothetical protein
VGEPQRANHPFVSLRVNERFRLVPFVERPCPSLRCKVLSLGSTRRPASVERPQSPGPFTAVPNDGESFGSVELRSCGPPIVSIAAPGPIRFFPMRNSQHRRHSISILQPIRITWFGLINFGVGLGVTQATDHLIIKGILGRHFSWHKVSPIE